MEFVISDTDSNWIEKNLLYLIKTTGFPFLEGVQFQLNEQYFPKTISTKNLEVECLISDISKLLSIDEYRIKYEVVKDLRDTFSTPFEIQGKTFESDTQIVAKNQYVIYISNSLIQRPNRLICSIIVEFLKIKLLENEVSFENRTDIDVFLFLVGLFFGFGVILTQKRIDIGYLNSGFWESKWTYRSEMPDNLIVYAFGIYKKIFTHKNADWIDKLPSEIKKNIEQADKYISKRDSFKFSYKELKYSSLLTIAEKEKKNKNYSLYIEKSQELIELIDNNTVKAKTYNNIGYYQIFIGQIEESILSLKQSLLLDSNSGYANDNLAYALIIKGELDECFKYLEKAIQTGNNNIGYSARNFAVYFLKKGDLENAKKYFEIAFNNNTIPIDFIEFHFSEYLFKTNNYENAMKYLDIAVNKGELIAINWKNEL
ncbi:MAG: hypothetical protein WCK02_17900 [Bacteroidota bacterium]